MEASFLFQHGNKTRNSQKHNDQITEEGKKTQQLRAVNIENMLDMQYSVVPGPPVRPGHPVSPAGLFP